MPQQDAFDHSPGQRSATACRQAHSEPDIQGAGSPRATIAELKIMESLRENPHDLDAVYSQLQDLRARQSSKKFREDLSRINSDLQKCGFLPDLEICQNNNRVDDTSGVHSAALREMIQMFDDSADRTSFLWS
jgi:hypothetical protein